MTMVDPAHFRVLWKLRARRLPVRKLKAEARVDDATLVDMWTQDLISIDSPGGYSASFLVAGTRTQAIPPAMQVSLMPKGRRYLSAATGGDTP